MTKWIDNRCHRSCPNTSRICAEELNTLATHDRVSPSLTRVRSHVRCSARTEGWGFCFPPMSYRLTSLILRMAQCPCPQKIVLAVIADMADDDGMCWPSLETIALRAGMTRRSVIDQVEKLEAAGLLSVSRGGRSNKYQIVLPGEPRSQVKDVHMCTTFTRPVNDVHQTSEPRSPQVVNDVHPKLSVKQSMKGSEKLPHTAVAEGKERTTSGKRNYGPEPEACSVTLPAGTDPELADAWGEWQTYRYPSSSSSCNPLSMR